MAEERAERGSQVAISCAKVAFLQVAKLRFSKGFWSLGFSVAVFGLLPSRFVSFHSHAPATKLHRLTTATQSTAICREIGG
jgi:hypothetical protein